MTGCPGTDLVPGHCRAVPSSPGWRGHARGVFPAALSPQTYRVSVLASLLISWPWGLQGCWRCGRGRVWGPRPGGHSHAALRALAQTPCSVCRLHDEATSTCCAHADAAREARGAPPARRRLRRPLPARPSNKHLLVRAPAPPSECCPAGFLEGAVGGVWGHGPGTRLVTACCPRCRRA